MSIESSSPITRLLCRSHQPLISFKDDIHCQATVTLTQEKNESGDFMLIYRFADMRSPYLLYEELKDTKEYAYALSFTPAYCENSTNLKEVDMDQKKKISDDTLQGSGEYIFLLDTSGSMSGSKIKMAVNSLIYFMKSLPPNSKFNIALFDSTFNLYYQKSVPYTEENAEATLARIENENFRFGGTEIYQPLDAVFHQECDPKYPRVLFLITDGEVSNKDGVIKLIKNNSRQNVVHALGIGSDVDKELIIKCARAGNGCHKFVTNPEEISANVIDMLSHSIKPAYVDMSVKWNRKSCLEWPKKNNIPFAYQGSQIYLCGIFGSKLKESVLVSFIDTINLEKKELCVSVENFKEVNGLGKIIAHNCIKGGDESGLGVKYNVLCKETAIYAEMKSTTAISEEPKKIEISLVKEEAAKPYIEKEEMMVGGLLKKSMKCRQNPPKMKASPHNNILKCSNERDYKMKRNIVVEDAMICCCDKMEECMDKVLPDVMCEAMPMPICSNPAKKEEKEEETKEYTKTKTAKTGLEGVIQQQKVSGLWELNAVCAELSKSEQQINEAMPEKIKQCSSAVVAWCTVIMVAVLHKKYAGDQAKWKLVANKAINKLKSMGVVYADYESEANKLI